MAQCISLVVFWTFLKMYSDYLYMLLIVLLIIFPTAAVLLHQASVMLQVRATEKTKVPLQLYTAEKNPKENNSFL